MPVGFTASCAEEPRAGQLDIMPSTTWLLVALPLPVFPSPKSPSGCSGLTGRDQMVSHSLRGKAASRCAGTSLILPSSWVICHWSRQWGRGGSRIDGHSQGGKVRGYCWTSHIWTNSCWNLGRFQCVSYSSSEWSWQEDLLNFWWHQIE